MAEPDHGAAWPFNLGISDKLSQGYGSAYLTIAAELGPSARVCEVGVYHGQSLNWWKALFPFGHIVGVDNDPEARWPSDTIEVRASQDDPQLPELTGGPFDLIVDDASHDATLTAETFRLLWPLVAPGGYYVIEDWWVSLEGVDDGGMLAFVERLPRLLTRDSPCRQVTFQFGLAIVQRRR